MAAGGAALCITGAGSVSALAETGSSGSATGTSAKRIRSSCRACGKMECGVWVTVTDGKVTRVEGDESCPSSKGNCCSKSQASLQACYHPDRLHYPLQRTGIKGEDPAWERVSWDEALSTMADNYQAVIDKYGGQAIFVTGGASRVWCMASYGALKVLFNTPNAFLGYEICKGPRHFASIMCDDMGSPWMKTVMQPNVYVQWGTATEYSNYDDSCRTSIDASQHSEAHILIDPRQGALGKEADYWLSIRPGTDAYVCQCWTNLVIERELYDELYVRKWMNAPYLFSEDIEPSGGYIKEADEGVHTNTRLLTESKIVEGGSEFKWLVYDENWEELAAKGVVHQYGQFTWFDSETQLWEHETEYRFPTTGTVIEQPWNASGVQDAWLPDPLGFDPEIWPAIYGEYSITLKNGKTVTVRPVWELYAERCAEYTPERTEELTGAKASVIEDALMEWATRRNPLYGNGGLHFQLATDQTGNSTHLVRMLMLLSQITGNYDSPAGNRGETKAPLEVSPGVVSMSMPSLPEGVTYFMKNANMVGADKYPLLRYWNKWAASASIWDAANFGDPYYLKACLSHSGNFMAFSNCTSGWEALQKLDFYASIDMWQTPQSSLADVMLPCVHWLEADSPRCSQGASGACGATVAAIDPPGECMIDYDIDIKFWKAMGTPWNTNYPEWDAYPTHDRFLDWCCRNFHPASTWSEMKEQFQENGWWEAKNPEVSNVWGTYHRYEMGKLRQVGQFTEYPNDGKPGFNTPTGKSEIWSTVVESYGLDSVYENYEYSLDDCMPVAREPYVSPLNAPEKFEGENTFNCTTGRRNPVYFHSEHRQLPWCRELWPVPRIEMNPADAERLGLEQGDWVWIENENGKIREVIDLYHGIDKGVVNLEHTWWYPEITDVGHGWQHSACNQLVYQYNNDPFCGSSTLRAYDVKVYKATAENSPFGNPVPCDNAGVEIITSSSDPRLKEWVPDYDRDRN